MSRDDELEYLKRKRLLQIQRRLLTEKAVEAPIETAQQQEVKQSKESLKTLFAASAWKVWQAAEQQYPQVSEEVAKALVVLYEAGKLREKITGEQLYWLFLQLGIRIRIKTRIRILESGELKTIADKLREK